VTFRNDANLDTSQVSDQRGSGGMRRTGMIAGGGGVGLLVLIVTMLVNGLGGSSSNPLVDLNNLLAPSAGGTGLSHCKTGADANTYEDCRIVGYVDSIQAYWAKALPASGKAYTEAQTVFFTDSTDTAGSSSSSRPTSGPREDHSRRPMSWPTNMGITSRTSRGRWTSPAASREPRASRFGPSSKPTATRGSGATTLPRRTTCSP